MALVMNQPDSTQTEAKDTVADPLANMSKHQLYLVLSQMKNLIHHNQQQAREILISNPEFTKTLFQAQIMFGMVRVPEALPLASTSTQGSCPTQAMPMHCDEPQAQVLSSEARPWQDHEHVFTVGQDYEHRRSIQGQDHPNYGSVQGQDHQNYDSAQGRGQELRFTQWQDHQHMLPQGLDYQPRSTQGQDHHQHRSTQAQVHLHSHAPGQVQWSQPLVSTSPYNYQAHEQAGSSPSVMALHSQKQSSAHHVLLPPLGRPPSPLPQQSQPSVILQHQRSHGFVDFQLPQDKLVYLPQAPSQMSHGDMDMEASNDDSKHLGQAGKGWDQAMAPTGHHPYPDTLGGSHLTHAHGYGQPSLQPQPLPEQPQVQMSATQAEQKALLEQVLSLTPDQIDSLPLEQRQQVLQVHQAFRSRVI